MQEQQPTTKPKLLFVDDEQRVLNSMRVMFRRSFDLFLASQGSEALEIINREKIDVIVADHRMPRMTGVELLASTRKLSPRTVRILLTGYADLDAVEGSINDGEVFRFLTKPCPPSELRATVELAVKIARSRASEPPETRVEAPPQRLQEQVAGDVRSADSGNAAGPSDKVRISGRAAEPADEWTRTMTEQELTTTAVIDPPIFTDATPAEEREEPAQASGCGIVLFTSDDRVVKTVRRATRDRLPIYVAGNIVHVVKILSQHRPGVLLTDISDDRSTLQSMTARLKEHLPELVTIVVSEHRDVLDMVWLINHGQIFRFLRKPLSIGRCAVSLQAAIQHHQALLAQPGLAERHAVARIEETGMLGGMIDTLRAVRRLWA